jgi:hypothetical protein
MAPVKAIMHHTSVVDFVRPGEQTPFTGARRSNRKTAMNKHLVQCFVPNGLEPFNFFFQMQLAAPKFDEHPAIVIRAMEQCLVDLIFEPLKISNMG